MKRTKTIIGWCEQAALPDWGIGRIRAKIDTGAKSSSIHVEDIKEASKNRITFYVVLDQKKRRKKVTAVPVRQGRVKSSAGFRTHRWYVQTRVRIGDVERTVKINLVGRDEMNFRMLIGRTALEDDFLVDAARRYTLKKKARS